MNILEKIFPNIFGKYKENKQPLKAERCKKTVSCDIDYSKYYKLTYDLPDDFVVYDLETTGFNPEQDKIIQIGAIQFVNNTQTAVFNTYVNPQMPIPKHITKITGIRDKDVANAPTIAEALPRFLRFAGSSHLIAHNAHFDMKFLTLNKQLLNIQGHDHKVVDTLSLSRKYIKDINGDKLSNYKLETLKELLDMDFQSHDALNDCMVCAEVYKKCKIIHCEKNN